MESVDVPQPAKAVEGVILVVEDDDAVRRLTTTALRRFGYEVLAASNGKEALQLAEENADRIHLLLTDVVMPGISGPQLVLLIQERFPHIKTLLMSGYTDDAVVRHGLLDAAVSFLQKPFTPTALVQKIRQALDT